MTGLDEARVDAAPPLQAGNASAAAASRQSVRRCRKLKQQKRTKTLGAIRYRFKVVLVLGPEANGTGYFTPLSPLPYPGPAQLEVFSVLRVLLGLHHRDVDEPRARVIGTSAGGGFLDDLNPHDLGLLLNRLEVSVYDKLTGLPQMVERHVDQPGPKCSLLLRVFLAVHVRSPFSSSLMFRN
jgi:hypothetical protein